MNIKVRDLKQTETIENSDKLMVLVDDNLNLVKNITKEEFLTNIISESENNALVQETDGNLYVNTSEISDSITELDERVTAIDTKFTNQIGDLNNLTTEDKTNLVSAINEAAITGASEINNPFFFGISLYSEVNPNNASWLLSNGQDNTQGMYPDYYDWILENVNNGTENFKGSIGYCYKNINGSGWWWISTDNPKVGMTVYEYNSDSIIPVGTVQSVSNGQITFNHKFSNIVYTCARNAEHDAIDNWITDYDWVINTTNNTFRLPLLNGKEAFPGNDVVDITSKVTTSTYNFRLPKNGMVKNILTLTNTSYYTNVYNLTSNTGQECRGNGSPLASIEGKRTDLIQVNKDNNARYAQISYTPFIGKGNLYFYVGATVQNADLINAGEITSALALKTDKAQAAQASGPSPTKSIPLTLGASGATYTAPTSGYVNIVKVSTGAGQNLQIQQGALVSRCWSTNIKVGYSNWLRVQKGTFTIIYTMPGNTEKFIFIPTQGEE